MFEFLIVISLIAMHVRSESMPNSYEFIKDSVRCWNLDIGFAVDGYLDGNGDWNIEITDLPKAINAYRTRSGRLSGKLPWLMQSKYPNEKVYEYRSGILIPMIFHERLGLMPEVGGKMVEFKDYEYSPAARRIYNLPGFFRPK